MRLKDIHRALRFKQCPWMKPYIRMNTELRVKASSDFERDLYKLMNNSDFGNTMENLRKRVDVKLVRANEEDRLRRLIASPAFDYDLAAIQVPKSRLVLNRPVNVEMSLLDLSKHLMYVFYYGELKTQYRERCQILYTDTDSLLLEIQTEEKHENMTENAHLYDTFDYPVDHPLHSPVNKKVLGKMKDECAGRDSIRRANRMAARSSYRQRSRDFCPVSNIVRPRGPGILCRLACHPTPSIAK